ncbi:hypothetical protein Goklo_004772 [Gossypium klotzschianum]|uniref:Transposase MuDR plant domain-containing protein n=1 Tax=Gossypium klotzschianum TaxID=34286 RepID=A0A7J8VPT4_9ROSI|nr:hypothetical protein [Gossypium klotzschianum]
MGRVDEDIGMESGGHISLGSTVGEDNDSEVAAGEYVGDFATSDELDNVAITRNGEEEDGNEIEVWDSDEHERSAIRKYSKECRRQLKFIKNEPKRVVVRCIASPNCSWRIRASYSLVVKCLQIKTIQDEHHCLVSFKNKMDYAHELRSKIPGSTIKMVVQRVAADFLPHFKRYSVCFDALKRG